jgi:hypothetical protein
VSNLNLDNNSKETLLSALMKNFEHFDVINNVTEESSIFLTSNKTRYFMKNNFIAAYKNGSMNIDDLVYVLF